MRLGKSLHDYFYANLPPVLCGSGPDMANTLPAEGSFYYSLNDVVADAGMDGSIGTGIHDVDSD